MHFFSVGQLELHRTLLSVREVQSLTNAVGVRGAAILRRSFLFTVCMLSQPLACMAERHMHLHDWRRVNPGAYQQQSLVTQNLQSTSGHAPASPCAAAAGKSSWEGSRAARAAAPGLAAT